MAQAVDVIETSADGKVIDAEGSETINVEGSAALESKTSWPAVSGSGLKLGMEKVMDDELRAKAKMNRIEQAINA